MTQITDEGQIYQLDKLMEETRSLAAKYRAATGQTLPVSHDLACYDAIRLLSLQQPQEVESAIDAIKMTEADTIEKYTIKGRVQFSNNKGKQARIGQLNMDADWQVCLLVIMDDDYQPELILKSSKSIISEVMSAKPANKRGAMTVAQFHKISEIVWQSESKQTESD